jgi:hypothetical protein
LSQRGVVLDACEAYEIELDDEARKKIQQEKDPVVLRAWLQRAAAARSAEEIFTG